MGRKRERLRMGVGGERRMRGPPRDELAHLAYLYQNCVLSICKDNVCKCLSVRVCGETVVKNLGCGGM